MQFADILTGQQRRIFSKQRMKIFMQFLTAIKYFEIYISYQVLFMLFLLAIFLFFHFFYLTYSPWISPLPSCLWSLRIFPSLPGSRLTIFYRDASSALLQLVNQWLNFTYSRSRAFRYERKSTNPTWVRIELTTSALAGVQVTY